MKNTWKIEIESLIAVRSVRLIDSRVETANDKSVSADNRPAPIIGRYRLLSLASRPIR